MLPNVIDQYFVPESFFAKNYLPTQSCIEIDKQLGEMAIDLDRVTKLAISGGGFKAFDKLKVQQIAIKLKNQLLLLIKARENQSALLDCRNKIENVRQNETASLFETSSAADEKRILADNKTKQYLLIGVGAAALLTSLVLIIRKNK